MELPISKSQAAKVSNWLKVNYGKVIENALIGTDYKFELVAAIACKETAYKWLLWIDDYNPNTILERCVFDASGEPEFINNPRKAFPKNRNEFKAHYGAEFLQMLIDEGNKQRAMPQMDAPKGYGKSTFLYKGYGLFQYDLQNIVNDEVFFRNKLWYNMEDCLHRFIEELNEKAKTTSVVRQIVKAYNGSGIKADSYADSVMTYIEWV